LSLKISCRPGGAKGNHYLFASGGWGSPHKVRVRLEERRATVTDAA
jgi:hypothetical protein